jgi:uncharacterized membrane protein
VAIVFIVHWFFAISIHAVRLGRAVAITSAVPFLRMAKENWHRFLGRTVDTVITGVAVSVFRAIDMTRRTQ